ncbi:MAG: glycosyl hydrolase [Chloroflexi bacterium]|nr:glycosyl hydrolase [Chloroflexota bacterium]
MGEGQLGKAVQGVMQWRLIGPHRGGRVVAVAGDPVDPLTFYFGAVAGGVWKTADGGISWHCVSDGYFTTAAVGAVVVAPSDPNVVYAGTGEATIRSNVSHGDGIYRSTDGGKTWTNAGLSDTRHIGKVKVHPSDPDTVFVAALGHAYGPNSERGIFRTTDGGKSWQRVLYRNDHTGGIDVSIDPTNPRIIYAALWEAQRSPHQLISGGPGSGIFRSTNGGDTWTELTRKQGLPVGVLGKIGIIVSPVKPGRVWALVEAEDGALFRSDDGGDTWTRMSEAGDLRRRAWYYMHVYADTQDADTVWVLDLSLWKSIDGGKTFTSIPTPHGDNHDLWIDPKNPLRMVEGNDGGACVTFDGGVSWSTIFNQPTAQFYHVITDNQHPYRVYGSQQDQGWAISIPSRSNHGYISQLEWNDPGGGESGYIAVKPDDPNIVVGGAIGNGPPNGRLLCYDHRTKQRRNIAVWPDTMGMGTGAKDLKYRFQWTYPISFSPHDPNTLYVAANYVFKSTDLGDSWEIISPDLTRNDPTKLQPSGGPITKDNTGAEAYCTIFAFVESPHQPGLFWAGTDDGLVHLSQDGGKTWIEITPPSLPEWSLISMIEPSPFDAASAYIAATRYKHDDCRPYLFKTMDYGRSWQRITSGIPAYDFTRVIRADPVRRGLLYAGTETGLYISFDDGGTWLPARGNLPVVPVHDVKVKDDELVAATHGRSFWILDDLTALRQLTPAVAESNSKLFEPKDTVRFRLNSRSFRAPQENDFRSVGPIVVTTRRWTDTSGKVRDQLVDCGENPPEGVVITYFLKEKPQGTVKLSFFTLTGDLINSYASDEEQEEGLRARPKPTADAGINRFVWNLRYREPRAVPGDTTTQNSLRGALVPPGTYEVRLDAGGDSPSTQFNVLKDPRLTVANTDLEAQTGFVQKVNAKITETHNLVLQLRDVRQQIQNWLKRIKGHEVEEQANNSGRTILEQLDAIEVQLIEPKPDTPLGTPNRLNVRLASLALVVDMADYAPTKQSYEVFAVLSGLVDAQRAQYDALLSGPVASLSTLLQSAGLPTLYAGNV